MLESDTRVVLLDQLRPPPGYKLQAAIATTFSLDFPTALVAPLAFASHEVRGTPDPIEALEAVRSCTDRVDVFCQAGQIAVPPQHSDLMAYLETMLHPAHAHRRGFLFHPKVWFLLYRSDSGGADTCRLICSTRNLTGSTAWDAAVTLDGDVSDTPDEQNEPLAKLIATLPSLAVQPLDPARSARIAELAETAKHVRWHLPADVHALIFHAFGLPGEQPTPNFDGYRHFVVSPFCNDAGLARIVGQARGDVALLSCAEALDQLSPATLAGRGGHALTTFVLDPLAVINDSDDDTNEVDTLSGLHAKVTVLERASKARLFVGSANATAPAYGGNVEFVVELEGSTKNLGVDALMGGADARATLLEPYPAIGGGAPDPTDERLRELKQRLRAVAEVPLTVTVGGSEPGFHLHLTSDRHLPHLGSGHRLTAQLLTMPGTSRELAAATGADARFDNVALTDVTPFVVLRLSDGEAPPVELSTVVHATLVGDDSARRLDEILARQVNTPEKFLRFLALLLGVGGADGLLAGGGAAGGEFGDWTSGAGTGVFETLVNALASRSAALKDLSLIVARMRSTDAGRSVLPPGFDQLWDAIAEALAQIEEAR